MGKPLLSPVLQPPYFLVNCDCGPKRGSKQRIPLDGYRVLEIRRHRVSSLWMGNKIIGSLSSLYFTPDNNQIIYLSTQTSKTRDHIGFVKPQYVRRPVGVGGWLAGVQLGRRGVTGHASTHDGVSRGGPATMAYGP